MAIFVGISCQSPHFCSSLPAAFEFSSHSQIATHQHLVCKLSTTGISFNPWLYKHSLKKHDWKLRPELPASCSVSRNAGVEERSSVSRELAGVPIGAETQVLERDEHRREHKKKQDTLISAHGWEILRIDHDDVDLLKQFADVQAETFHVKTSFFNDFFFTIFKAEVLSSLLHKIRHATPNRYACLAAIPECVDLARRRIVGVVDAAAMADRDVLRSLPGVDEYLYISGMAVDSTYSLQKQETEGCHSFTSSMRLDSSAMGL